MSNSHLIYRYILQRLHFCAWIWAAHFGETCWNLRMHPDLWAKASLRGSNILSMSSSNFAEFLDRMTGREGHFLDKILDEGSGKLEWNSGSVIPAVETLIQSAGLGGSARCTLKLSPCSHNPFHPCLVASCLEVQSEARQHFAGLQQDQTKLFEPSMAEQVHFVSSCSLSGCHQDSGLQFMNEALLPTKGLKLWERNSIKRLRRV